MIPYIFLSVLPSALLVAAINDIIELKIPNWISLGLVILFPVAAVYFGYSVGTVISCIFLALAVLAVGFVLFSFNTLGGGDVKLLASAALWIGPAAFPFFMFKVLLMGGVFAFILITFRRTPLLPVYAHAQWLARLHQSNKYMPYGVAIAAGGIWALPDTFLFVTMFS